MSLLLVLGALHSPHLSLLYSLCTEGSYSTSQVGVNKSNVGKYKGGGGSLHSCEGGGSLHSR
jgi:hypothetical protein